MHHKARIVGIGSYLPQNILSNSDLEKMVDTSDEWISVRTGIKERRIAAADEAASDMGYIAAERALEKAGKKAEEIDFIFVATSTPDYIMPNTACLIQARLKAVNAAAIDIKAACSGFIYALSMAKAMVDSGRYINILIVASEKISSIMDYKDRNTCVLFGDGAAACVVSNQNPGLFIRDVRLGADGDNGKLLIIPGGGSKHPSSFDTVSSNLHCLKMGGKEVFKHAVRRMESSIKECLDHTQLSENEISWFIPHQANMRIIEALAERFSIPSERIITTLHKYGNTSASSVGIALDEFLQENKLSLKENIVLTAFGAGLAWGSAILTYDE
jgi:3-oxoacyl-[acyl-carrier-protein] synthase-3